jgi:hypothetical protein
MRSGNDDLQIRIGSAFLYLKFIIFFHKNKKWTFFKQNSLKIKIVQICEGIN